MNFYKITTKSSTSGFRTTYDSASSGYLGLAPHGGKSTADAGRNFMYKLDSNNHIQYDIFGIGKDTIHLGTWDTSNGAEEKITMFKTIEKGKWDIKFDGGRFHSPKGPIDNMTSNLDKVLIDPAYPYIHLDKTTFGQFVDGIEANNKMEGMDETQWSCSTRFCTLPKSCSDLPESPLAGLIYELVYKNEVNQYDLYIDLEKYLFDGAEEFGDQTPTCYLGVFHESNYRSPDGLDRSILGSMFLDQYYAVFDQTPVSEDEENYNFIGLVPYNGEIKCEEEICVRAVPHDMSYSDYVEKLKNPVDDSEGGAGVIVGILATIIVVGVAAFAYMKRKAAQDDQTFAQGKDALVNEED